MTAIEVAETLSDEEKAAMLSMAHGRPGWRNAVRVDVYWMTSIALQKKDLISDFPRSGDNAYPMTPFGIEVRDILEANSRT